MVASSPFGVVDATPPYRYVQPSTRGARVLFGISPRKAIGTRHHHPPPPPPPLPPPPLLPHHYHYHPSTYQQQTDKPPTSNTPSALSPPTAPPKRGWATLTGAPNTAWRRTERVERAHLRVVQHKVELCVGHDAVFAGRLGDDGKALLQGPAEEHGGAAGRRALDRPEDGRVVEEGRDPQLSLGAAEQHSTTPRENLSRV